MTHLNTLLLACCLFGTTSLFGQNDTWVVEKLPSTVNSLYDEIAPVPSRDGRYLFFTRVGYPDFDKTLIFDTINYAVKLDASKYNSMLGRMYGELGQTVLGDPSRSTFNQDVWYALADSVSNFQVVQHPNYPLNNALPNSLVAITPDPQAFYIINQFKPEGDMKRGFSIIRRTSDSTWAFPKPVQIKDYYTITSDVNLTMSFDGKVLILAAARFDSRDLDLYICTKEGENQWSAPQNLGMVVNSANRELTPFLSEDNRTLYFASSRGNNSGSLDLYMSRRMGEGWLEWTPPIQLVSPINSTADETQPYFNMTSGFLYFASKRAGSSDLYRVRIAPPQPTEIIVRGRVIHSQTRELMNQTTVQYSIAGSEGNSILAPDGLFEVKIPKGIPFDFVAQKTGFTGIRQEVVFRLDYYYFREYYTIDLEITPLTRGSSIDLQSIFFQQSTALILEESNPQLIYLTQLLKNNPLIRIRIEGHTDNIGKTEDLIQLSQARADAIKQHLIEQGILSDRIESVRKGPSSPINDNSTDELRSKNRRVSCTVISNE